MEALCILGSSLDPKDDTRRASPVVMAASEGRKAIVDVLLRFGANLFDRDRKGRTALQLAVVKHHFGVIMTLNAYSRGFAGWLNSRDRNGNTALHRAAEKGLTDAAKLLVKLGAEKNLQNDDGRTPLDLAFAMADIYPLTAPELKEMGCRETFFKGIRDLLWSTPKEINLG